jgi:hypothetical protein
LFGAMWSAIALVIYLFGGNRPLEHLQVSLVRAIVTYLVAGGLAGLLIGLVLPLTRWMLGAALLAFVVAFVIWFVIGWSTSPDDPMLDILKSSALLGAAFGLPMGIGFWYQARHYDRSGKWT